MANKQEVPLLPEADAVLPTLADIHEVRRLGRRDSAFRTADQTAAALFWHCAPVSLWAEAAGMVLGQAGDADNLTRGLALISRALSQVPGVMAAQGARRPTPRPIEFIRGTAPSRLAAISIEPAWEPLVTSKHDAGYPSISCLRTGTVAGLLRAIMGGDGSAISLINTELGLTRSFANLTSMLQEVEDAKVWAGTHLRPVAVESTELGLRLGASIVREA